MDGVMRHFFGGRCVGGRGGPAARVDTVARARRVWETDGDRATRSRVSPLPPPSTVAPEPLEKVFGQKTALGAHLDRRARAPVAAAGEPPIQHHPAHDKRAVDAGELDAVAVVGVGGEGVGAEGAGAGGGGVDDVEETWRMQGTGVVE